MAEVQSAPMHNLLQPRGISEVPSTGIDIPTTPTSVTLPPRSSVNKLRNSHMNLDTFSPVNQNGSFEFDRVLKCGYVEKRTRKTKAWKSIYLVLRPNLLSIYKDAQETKLRHKIQLTDLTAVAFLKDPKQKRRNVFGLFSPSRNYHLEASSHQDAEEWVNLIRKEARFEEEEEEMFLASPGGHATSSYHGFEREMSSQTEQRQLHDERVGSSSPEPIDPLPLAPPLRKLNSHRRPSHNMEYSGNESGFYSETSDQAPSIIGRLGSSTSVTDSNLAVQSPENIRPIMGARNASQLSGFDASLDPERVVWQGYLMYLKSTNGIRQWKDLWAVLRPRSLSLYKDDLEYRPILIIDMDSVRGAVEIDPLSRSKSHCLQVITEEKGYRFCAHAEIDLTKCLGAFKSLLVKRGR